jgi:hypothetical protein
LNKVFVPKHQQIPIQHKDIVAFASISKFSYFFHYPPTEISEEPLPKKLCLYRNACALQTPLGSTESLDRTMKNKKIDTQLVTKCDIKGVPSNKLHRQNEVFEPFSFRRMLDNKDILFRFETGRFRRKNKRGGRAWCKDQ